MKTVILMAAVALIGCAVGCDHKAPPNDTAADNTKMNERDKNPTLTPLDQSEKPADRDITQKIRQDVVKANDLSMDAKNVKIITIDGVVTLRGPVKSQAEKDAIGTLAQNASGVKRIDNQLEIAN